MIKGFGRLIFKIKIYSGTNNKEINNFPLKSSERSVEQNNIKSIENEIEADLDFKKIINSTKDHLKSFINLQASEKRMSINDLIYNNSEAKTT